MANLPCSLCVRSQGPMGPKGHKGITGDMGPKGHKGITGDKGPGGDKVRNCHCEVSTCTYLFQKRRRSYFRAACHRQLIEPRASVGGLRYMTGAHAARQATKLAHTERIMCTHGNDYRPCSVCARVCVCDYRGLPATLDSSGAR
jgi:hypothetical protein